MRKKNKINKIKLGLHFRDLSHGSSASDMSALPTRPADPQTQFINFAIYIGKVYLVGRGTSFAMFFFPVRPV
jgi:hypothetical protein